jgi:toxin secretion/phage lysis holin
MHILNKLFVEPLRAWFVAIGSLAYAHFSQSAETLAPLVLAVLTMFFADFIVGVAYAIKRKKVNSKTMANSIWKLLAYGALFLVGLSIDFWINGYLMESAILITILSVEGLSVLENLKRLGVKIPRAISDKLESIGVDDDA